MLKAVYKDENTSWIIILDEGNGEENVLLQYTLDYVPVDYIIQSAVKYGKLDESAFFYEGDDVNEDILRWFASEIFPSREFGEDLLESFRIYIKNLIDTGDIEKYISDEPIQEEDIPQLNL